MIRLRVSDANIRRSVVALVDQIADDNEKWS
jgi:hypothetical protein